LQINAINENKPLLWDEPENHLHPAWQIKFAEMLVLLSKSGIPIVVSTHSPYFIQSIRYYSQKYQLASYVNYYMNEIGDDGLVTVKEVTNDLGKVFARLSAPLTEVLNLSNIE
jgi:predicted ATPase